MSVTQINARSVSHAAPDQRAGNLALVLLRFTLIGVGLAMVGTVGSVVLKVVNG